MDQQKDSGLNSNSFSLSQDSIIGTLMKFESAIAGLTSTVEQTRHNIEHVVDLSMKSKEELKHIKDSIMPYISTAKNASQKVVTKVKANPRSIALVLSGIVGGLLLWGFYQNRNSFQASSTAVH